MGGCCRLFLRAMFIMLWLFNSLLCPSSVHSAGKYLLNGSMVIITSPPSGDGNTAAAGAASVKWLDFAVPRDRSQRPIITVNREERFCVQADNLEELLRTFNRGELFAGSEEERNSRRYSHTQDNEGSKVQHQSGIFVIDKKESGASSYMEIFLEGWIRLYPLAIVATCTVVFATISGVLLYIHVMAVMQDVYANLDMCFTDPMMDAYIVKPGRFGTDAVVSRAAARRRAEEHKSRLQRPSPGALISPLRIGNLQEWKKDMEVWDGKSKTDQQLSGAWKLDLNRWIYILTKGRLGKNEPFVFNAGVTGKHLDAQSNNTDNEVASLKQDAVDSSAEDNTPESLQTAVDKTGELIQEIHCKENAESNATKKAAQTVATFTNENITSMETKFDPIADMTWDQELEHASSSLVNLIIGYVLTKEENKIVSHQKILTRSQPIDIPYNKSDQVSDGISLSGRKDFDQAKGPGQLQQSISDTGCEEMQQRHDDIPARDQYDNVNKPKENETFGEDRIRRIESMVEEINNTHNDEDNLTNNMFKSGRAELLQNGRSEVASLPGLHAVDENQTADCGGYLMSKPQEIVGEKQASPGIVEYVKNNDETLATQCRLETEINELDVSAREEENDTSDLCQPGVNTKQINLCEGKENVITEFAENQHKDDGSDENLVKEQGEMFDLNLVKEYVDGILKQAVEKEKSFVENGQSDQILPPNMETTPTVNINTDVIEDESEQLAEITDIKNSLLEITKQAKNLRKQLDEYYQSEAYRFLCSGEEGDETFSMNESAILYPQYEVLGIQSLIMETQLNLNHLQRVKNSLAITGSKSCGNAIIPKATQGEVSSNKHKLSVKSARIYVENYNSSDNIVQKESSNED